MLRFIFVIVISLPSIIYYLCVGEYIERHSYKYSEEDKYKVAQKVIACLKRNGFIRTKVYGTDNLPKEDGYVMYSNHQGKYDALGIMYGHSKPCTVMMDDKRSHMIIVNQFIRLIDGCRLDKSSAASQVKAIRKVTEEVKNGRRYIVFPEGGYFHNRNEVHEFLPGAFKCAVRAKKPIVPVAIIDSYKPFEVNSLKKVTTQVHYLPAITYNEYKNLTTEQIADMVRERIVNKINNGLLVRKKAA